MQFVVLPGVARLTGELLSRAPARENADIVQDGMARFR